MTITSAQRQMISQALRSLITNEPWWKRIGSNQGAILFNAIVFLAESDDLKPANSKEITAALKKEAESAKNGKVAKPAEFDYVFKMELHIPGVNQKATIEWSCPRKKFEGTV